VNAIRLGVVGCGSVFWTPYMNLIERLRSEGRVDVVAVYDSDPGKRRLAAQRLDLTPDLPGDTAVCIHPEVDVVLVLTSMVEHGRLARAALEAGKHTFVEKPLAGSLAEATQLAALAQDLGLVLMPGHTFLYSPPVQAIRDLIASGGLGEIYFVSTSRVNLGLHQSDASVVWDLGPHDFSILSYWLGETPVGVTALSRSCVMPDTPDVAFIQLEYASGIVANVELAWLAPSKLRRTTVVGSQKMVVYDDTSAESVRVFDSGVNLPDPESFGEYRLSYRTGDIISPRIPIAEPLALELEDLCRAIRTGSALRSTPQLGVEVVRVVEAAERSLAERARIEIAGANSPVVAPTA
jgi:predicted dehydrogenase